MASSNRFQDVRLSGYVFSEARMEGNAEYDTSEGVQKESLGFIFYVLSGIRRVRNGGANRWDCIRW